jgi:hypothetical protein
MAVDVVLKFIFETKKLAQMKSHLKNVSTILEIKFKFINFCEMQRVLAYLLLF